MPTCCQQPADRKCETSSLPVNTASLRSHSPVLLLPVSDTDHDVLAASAQLVTFRVPAHHGEVSRLPLAASLQACRGQTPHVGRRESFVSVKTRHLLSCMYEDGHIHNTSRFDLNRRVTFNVVYHSALRYSLNCVNTRSTQKVRIVSQLKRYILHINE